jgi:hypothetical protein
MHSVMLFPGTCGYFARKGVGIILATSPFNIIKIQFIIIAIA